MTMNAADGSYAQADNRDRDRDHVARIFGPWMGLGTLAMHLGWLLAESLGKIGVRRVRYVEASLIEPGRWIYALLEGSDGERLWESLPVTWKPIVGDLGMWALDAER